MKQNKHILLLIFFYCCSMHFALADGFLEFRKKMTEKYANAKTMYMEISVSIKNPSLSNTIQQKGIVAYTQDQYYYKWNELEYVLCNDFYIALNHELGKVWVQDRKKLEKFDWQQPGKQEMDSILQYLEDRVLAVTKEANELHFEITPVYPQLSVDVFVDRRELVLKKIHYTIDVGYEAPQDVVVDYKNVRFDGEEIEQYFDHGSYLSIAENVIQLHEKYKKYQLQVIQ